MGNSNCKRCFTRDNEKSIEILAGADQENITTGNNNHFLKNIPEVEQKEKITERDNLGENKGYHSKNKNNKYNNNGNGNQKYIDEGGFQEDDNDINENSNNNSNNIDNDNNYDINEMNNNIDENEEQYEEGENDEEGEQNYEEGEEGKE